MNDRITVLCGGIGGAKLALGLHRILPPGTLTVVVNTGDDFTHLGLAISPDVDTTVYTLADLADPVRGWGRRDETWTFMAALTALGGDDWFQLGDGDLAMHVERTRRLAAGEPPSEVTAALAARLGIGSRIVPMSDDPVRTRLSTPQGRLDFQDYFVRRRCEPRVDAVFFDGAERAVPAPGVLDALTGTDLRAVIVAPSNPYLSIDPILAVPGIRDALRRTAAPVVAISPIIAGEAVKGPTAKMMRELGGVARAADVAAHYGDFLDGFVIDPADADLHLPTGIAGFATPILMRTLADRESLAREVLTFADRIAGRSGVRS